MHLHNVYFSLKDKSPEAVASLLADCNHYLSVQSGIISQSSGVLVPDLNREVNDQDFDVSLHILFENRAAHDAYQDDEQHLIFIERNKGNWTKVRVFDSTIKSE